MMPADVDKRIAKAMKALQLMAEVVSDLEISEDGTGTAAGVGENADNVYDVEVCAGPFGFRSRPMDGAGGLMIKLGGEGGSAFVVGFRDRQYEISVDKGESVAFSASGAFTKWDKSGNIISKPAGAGKVQLGGDVTPDAALLGTTFNNAFQTFLAALNTFVGAVVTPTGVATPAIKATMQTAIATMEAVNILSQKVALQ
jgi:phage gp45-like